MAHAAQGAYLAALKMLARRELSEAQVRQRLSRRHPPEAVDAAVERLRAEGSLDDRRVADAIARTQITLKRRGERRVRQEIERAGISREVASQAVRDAFDSVDRDVLLDQALAKRLRGRAPVDQAERHRLYRYLVGQGFDPDHVLAALERHRRSPSSRTSVRKYNGSE